MFERMIERFRIYRETLRTEAELNRLSKRELDDLGISRCDIPRIARESVMTR